MKMRIAVIAAVAAGCCVTFSPAATAASTVDIALVEGFHTVSDVLDGPRASLSADGRFVAVVTRRQLVSEDTDAFEDVYRIDRQTGAVDWVSKAPGGQPQDWSALNPRISGDGRYVAFESSLNLVPAQRGPRSDAQQVFRYDAMSLAIELVSVNADGLASEGPAGRPKISADGNVVVFGSRYSDFGVAEDTNRRSDVYRRDMSSGETTLGSRTGSGEIFTCAEATPEAVSANGRYTLFITRCPDPTTTDTNGKADLFRFDAETGSSVLVSRTTEGKAAGIAGTASLSGSGRIAIYQSLSHRIVPGDTPDTLNLFRVDVDAGTTTMVPGTPMSFDNVTDVSSNGRFIALGRTGQFSGFAVFRVDTITGAQRRISVGDAGQLVGGSPLALSANGRVALFATNDPDLDADSEGNPGQLNLYAWQLIE